MVYFPYVTFVSVVFFIDIKFVSQIVCKFVGVSSKHLWVFLESLRQSSEIFRRFRKFSEILGNSRKMFGNIRLAFGTILKNLQKSSEGGRKSSENHKKCRHQHLYTIKRTLRTLHAKYCLAIFLHGVYIIISVPGEPILRTLNHILQQKRAKAKYKQMVNYRGVTVGDSCLVEALESFRPIKYIALLYMRQ